MISMEKIQYKFVYDTLMDRLAGRFQHLRIERLENEDWVWVLSDYVGLRFHKDKFIFNSELFDKTNVLEKLLPSGDAEMEPLVSTPSMIETAIGSIRKLQTPESAEDAYLQEKYLKLFPSNKYHFAHVKNVKLGFVYCYDSKNQLSGIITPFNNKKNGGN